MNLRFVPVLFTLAVIIPVNAGLYPLSDPDNDGAWVLDESLSDEFDQDALDLSKWNNLGFEGDYDGEWKGRAPSQYSPSNITVENGFLTLLSRWQPDFEFSDSLCSNGMKYGGVTPVTTAAITSKTKFRYGYLEMRCRAADGPISSSFWTTGVGGEIDVFEHYGRKPNDVYSEMRFHSSIHDWRKNSPTFGKRIWTSDHQLGFRVADDFHVYGLEWNRNGIKTYVDGLMVACFTKESIGDAWVVDHEQKVWIDSETFDWEYPPGKLTSNDFGDGRRFVIDYCRIWHSKQDYFRYEAGVNLISNSGFATDDRDWVGAFEVSTDAHSGQRAAYLPKRGSIEQTVRVKPNTTYKLSAWAKSPSTNEKNLWFNSFLGVKGQETNARFFLPRYSHKSLQFTTGPIAKTAVVYFTNNPHGEAAIVDDIQLVEMSQ